MGEPSSGECSPLHSSFNCLTVLPGSASILIRTEIGNGVLAGWGGVLWVVHSWTSALCGLPSFTLSLALTRVRSPHPFRFLPPGWRSKKGQEVQRKEAERGGERERKRREREKLASKAETVHAGNTEIAPPGWLRMQLMYSQCGWQLGIVEFVPFWEFAQS